MARKIATYTVSDEGRDKGKVFILTEMPASQAESWAMRALLALMNGNVELPPGFESMGMAGMAEMGIRALAGLSWHVAGPLLDEMWQCVQIQPDPANAKIIRALIEEDIEEIKTRVMIRAEIWKLHTDFLKGVARFAFANKQAAESQSDSQST
jgi:hypothetical protein